MTNVQIPMSKEIPMTKHQLRHLGIGNYLLIGPWSLGIHARTAAVAELALCAASALLRGRLRMISMSLKTLLSRAPCCFTQSAMAVMPSSRLVFGLFQKALSHLL